MADKASLSARLRRLTRSLNAHDLADLRVCLADEVVFDRGDAAPLQGAERVIEWARGLIVALPDLHFAPLELIALDDGSGLVRWTLSGTRMGRLTSPFTGMSGLCDDRAVALAISAHISFDDHGAITRFICYGDMAVLQAMAPAEEPALSDEVIDAMVSAYATAWCSGDPNQVGAHYTENGWITINGGPRSAGRVGVTAMARGFMETFPDMHLTADDWRRAGDRVIFFWTFTGSHVESGQSVSVSGYEVWLLDGDCKVLTSYGYFDSASYAHQVEKGRIER